MSQQAIIGLIGGMSWESSAEYYRIINQTVRERLGGLRSARCLMWSLDFGEIEALQHAGRWDDAAALMIDAATRLEQGGADFFLICTNTMHRMADQVQAAVRIPLLHIADPTADRIKVQGFKRVGLLGTAFTMEQEFYKGRLQHRFGLDVLTPDADDRATVHRIIYDELVQGRAEPASREAYRMVIAHLVEQGAEAIILGCTEIMLLVKPADSPVPLFDTTGIHAEAAVDRALSANAKAAVAKKIGLIDGLVVRAGVFYYDQIFLRYASEKKPLELVLSHADVGTVLACVSAGDKARLGKYLSSVANELFDASAQVVAVTAIAPQLAIDEIARIARGPVVNVLEIIPAGLKAAGIDRA